MRTTLPKTVPIGDLVFKVKAVHRERFKSDGFWVDGDMAFDARVIRVAVGTTKNPLFKDRVWAVFYHEVSHAIDAATEEARGWLVAETMGYLREWERGGGA